MAPKTKLSDDEKIIREAKERFERCESWEAETRRRFVEDLKFANADPDNNWQWDNTILNGRRTQSKPCLTINKTRQHNLQITNDAKQNKPGVNIRPVGDDASYDAAQVFEGIVRHIEYQSNGEQAYDTATMFQVQGGVGYWRVITDYVSDQSFDQEIYISRVKNPEAIYLDPDVSEADGSDARFGFVFEDIPVELFKSQYPEYEDMASNPPMNNTDGWLDKDHVRIAEYYRKEQKADKLISFIVPPPFAAAGQQIILRKSKMDADIRGVYEGIKEASAQNPNIPAPQERDIITDEITWYKLAGNKIIDTRPWLGKYVPIVRIVGEETVIDGKLDRKGHTRSMKDAQRMYNYWPLSLDTPIPTPRGWTKMGDIQVGDVILDDGGKPTNVRGMSDVFLNRQCFRITFDDGSDIVADAEHPWVVEERGKRKTATWEWSKKKLTTAELRPGDHFIATAAPLELPEADLIVDPYVLGAWLGDGRSAAADFTASKEDAPGMAATLRATGINVGEPVPSSTAMRIPTYGLVGELRKIGVLDNKHIPVAYLRASYDQRLSLLQGLMDTDGNVNRSTRQCSFDNSNPALMAGVVELIRSLGMKAFVRPIAAKPRLFPNGKVYDCAASERVSFTTSLPVFRMERKALIQNALRKSHARRTKRHAIKSIVEVPSVPVRCVSIDSPSHLFLAGPAMVPTHNTSEATTQVALQTKSPWVAPVEAIESLEDYWGKANVDNTAVLPYNSIGENGVTIPKPEKAQPPQMASAYIQGMQICQDQLMMTSGQYQSQFGQNENATSGKAINERQRQGDNATYHFIDNLAVGIRFTGKILVDLIPKIYDTERVIRILAKDGTESQIQIKPDAPDAYKQAPEQPDQNQQKAQKTQQSVAAIFNPNVGRYEVESDIGPGYATRRQEAFNAMTQIAAQNPEFMKVGGDLLWKSADFPLSDELAERWSRIIPPNIKGDAPPPEVQQMQGQMKQLQDAVAQLHQQLTDKEDDLQVRQYDAETKRLTALGNSNPQISVEQIQPLVMQIIGQMLRDGFGQEGQQQAPQGNPAPQQPPMPDASQQPDMGQQAPMPPQTLPQQGMM
ncbi:portal protein [Phyllobacterium sp. 22229]|uniref:portal protein n=1 Tax=Phyllobacterium sp. 22229 TaxID=3453895 RepID=UPI003F839608